jgi:hypothetical protein
MGNTLGHNFYMGTQNGLRQGILIHALEIKLWHFEVLPYVYMGKSCICNVLSPGVRYLEIRSKSL